MGMAEKETFPCQICGEHKERGEVRPAGSVREPVVEVIRKEYPGWSEEGYICTADLNRFRARYVREILEKESAELISLEENVKKSIKNRKLTARNINVEFDRQLSFGERISDRLADFAGSWIFIALFAVLFCIWIGMNSIVLLYRPVDPYPFIFLNLVLSALAALQAPVIIMSQNRQEARDRLHAEADYQVNLNTEMEIHQLHKKMDHFLMSQGQRLLEIQNIQVELMEELVRKAS
jgi:uncharacterized membrane protein